MARRCKFRSRIGPIPNLQINIYNQIKLLYKNMKKNFHFYRPLSPSNYQYSSIRDEP